MGFTSAWLITSHDDDFIRDLEPRMRELIDTARALPASRAGWERWAAEPLPDWRSWYRNGGGGDQAVREQADRVRERAESFFGLTSAGQFDELYDGRGPDDDFSVMTDVWGRHDEQVRPFAAVHSKEYPVAALFHALGSRRAALIPGWLGTFLLSAEQVRESLPRIEAAFSFSDEERALAEEQIWLDEDPGQEGVLDGPPRCWRQAAAHGLGLCGVYVHIY
ncbi:hypothetical protein [Streptomyces sp. MST-110588]|uniref:hypothetical protein n=1 Tax=Streptomyces sp. MST-110588 TaxID=2833628 RepID=UPI001F5CEDCD|nr:hypothetical protein [Streptomyces sp. MST-110588]UNO42679.1 hypothetical protein KGS77_28005 [Streptomyces sp. MST-110588]